jgi:hypothetical protein
MNDMQIQIKIFLLIKTVAAETNPLCKSEIFENLINTVNLRYGTLSFD